MTQTVLTITEVAEALCCSKAHVSNLINGRVKGTPRLPHMSLGRRKLVRRSSFEDWCAQLEQPDKGAILQTLAATGTGERTKEN